MNNNQKLKSIKKTYSDAKVHPGRSLYPQNTTPYWPSGSDLLVVYLTIQDSQNIVVPIPQTYVNIFIWVIM